VKEADEEFKVAKEELEEIERTITEKQAKQKGDASEKYYAEFGRAGRTYTYRTGLNPSVKFTTIVSSRC